MERAFYYVLSLPVRLSLENCFRALPDVGPSARGSVAGSALPGLRFKFFPAERQLDGGAPVPRRNVWDG